MKNAGKKEKLAPKLRFSEFRDGPEWDEKPIGALGDVVTGSTPDTARPEYYDGGIPFVSPADISDLRFVEKTRTTLTDLGFEETRPIRANSTLFVCIGSTIGKVAQNVRNCATNQQINSVIPNSDHAEPFVYYVLAKTSDRIAKLAGKHAVPIVNKTLFSSVRVPVPTPGEQQKVADCLSSLDELIAAERQKLDALKAHKKGLMQQLFPREGETIPRLRFPEFQNSEPWLQTKLGSVGDVLMCKRIFASETNDREGIPFYKIGTLGSKPDAYISKVLFDDYKSRYSFPRLGEVLITCSGTVGKCLPYNGKDAYYQDSNIVWIDNPDQTVSNELLLFILSSVNWGKLNSTTITRIYGPDLKSLLIAFPEDSAEQQKIASALSSIDEAIAAQSDKLATLEAHKNGLMQQLFPSTLVIEA